MNRLTKFLSSFETALLVSKEKLEMFAKQKTEQVVKPVNNLISTIRSTSRVAKWSVLLISSGIFLFGFLKAVTSVNNYREKI